MCCSNDIFIIIIIIIIIIIEMHYYIIVGSIEMVWASGKNGLVTYGQKGIDGESKWRAVTRESEVRLDG